MKLADVLEAYEKLTNRSLEISRLYNYSNSQNGYRTTAPISFERFCALMAEFSTTDSCEMCTTDGRVYYTPLYWKCALLKTRVFFKTVFNNTLGRFNTFLVIRNCHYFFLINFFFFSFFLVFKSVHFHFVFYIFCRRFNQFF